MDKKDKIYIAGHRGMVGSAILRLFEKEGFENLIFAEKSELNLMDQNAVFNFFLNNKPDYVILAAAKVGGIQANISSPAQFLYENLVIQNNVIHSAHLNKIHKFIFLGSSCIYPKDCDQPMKENYLLTGPLEPTNEGYALAKITGLKLLEYYYKQYGLKSISLMPCNLYGPNDSFDLGHSHVLSALVKRFSDAVLNKDNAISLWGSGIAKREFMHVDDAAKAVLFMTENYDSHEFINIGWGTDISIYDLAHLIAKKTNFTGEINWDKNKPDGMLRKCMDVSKMKFLGFKPEINLESGIEEMISNYKIFSQTVN